MAQLANKITVTVGLGISSLCYDLYEAKASEKKTELQTILFRLADRVSELTEQLKGKSVIKIIILLLSLMCAVSLKIILTGTGMIKLSLNKLLDPTHFRAFLFIAYSFSVGIIFVR